jgi:hypothetical protein
MKGRHDLSRIAALSICVILLLSLTEVPELEPFGLHLEPKGKRVVLSESDVEVDENQFPESVPAMTRPLLDDGLCIAIVAMLPGPSPCRSEPVDGCPGRPDEAGPGSSTVLRI